MLFIFDFLVISGDGGAVTYCVLCYVSYGMNTIVVVMMKE